jgi:hypothetical protein
MINLIPNEQKKKMKRDFLMRALIVSFFVFGFMMIVGSAALLPSYFHVMVKSNLVKSKLITQENTPVPAVEAEVMSKIDNLNKKLGLIENSPASAFVVSSRVIDDMLLKKIPEIKITDISYENTAKGRQIRVNGEAPSREKLLIFRLALEKDPAFKKVDLPISNFVKGTNINFFLTLVPA